MMEDFLLKNAEIPIPSLITRNNEGERSSDEQQDNETPEQRAVPHEIIEWKQKLLRLKH